MAETHQSRQSSWYESSSREITDQPLQRSGNYGRPKNISSLPPLATPIFPYTETSSDRETLSPALYDSSDPRNAGKMTAAEIIAAAPTLLKTFQDWRSSGSRNNAAIWQNYLTETFRRAEQLEAAGLLTAEDFAGIGMLNWRFGEALREPLGKSKVPRTLDGILGEVKMSEADATLIHDLMSLG